MDRWIGGLTWVVITLGVVAQFVLGLFLWYDWAGLDVMTYIGWAVWVPSVVLGWLPILILRRGAGVRKGESYIHTTVLVERGLYRVVRHPQYLSMMLLAVALMLISQHWAVAVIGVVVIASVYLAMWNEDKRLAEKFGDDYVRYMQAVPRANVVVGLVRLARRGARQHNAGGGASNASQMD